MIETAASYVPIDRRIALARGTDLPSRVTGTALDADLSGFTALTEALARELGEQRGAEELARRLNVIYDGLIDTVHRYGGTVLGFAGDAFSAWFEDDDGRRAVRCAQLLQEWMDAHAAAASGGLPPPRLKVTVATGTTRRFLVGDPDVQLVEGLAGELVDELAAAAHDAEAGEVVLAASAQASLGDRARVGDRGVLVSFAADAAPAPVLLPAVEPLSAVRPWLLPAVADRLAAGEGDFLADLRPATALFMHMSGIDYESDPDALARLDTFIRRVQGVLRSYEGTLLQLTIGDKGSYLYAAFGAPVAHEDDPVRALLAALELRAIGAAGDLVDPVSIGVASGRLRAGSYGGGQRRTYGVLGDTVNLAARLMQAAAPGEVVVASAVRSRAGGGFRWRARSPLTVKGKTEPIEVSVLAGRRTAAPRARRVGGPAMLGRGRELAELVGALDDAVAGRGRVVSVVADAGLGKSRLVAELAAEATRRGIVVHEADCPSFGVNGSYVVWQPLWNALLDVPRSGALSERVRAVEERLTAVDPALAARAPVLAPVLGLDIPDNALTRSLDDAVRKTALESTLVTWLQRTTSAPLVLVLEDCHWIDTLSEDLLAAIGRGLRTLPVLLVTTLRPRGETEGGELPTVALPHHRAIALDRLDDDVVAQLIAQRTEGTALQRTLADEVNRLAKRAEGNPFYVEELLDWILELGDAATDPARLAELPSTLQSLVLSRIDRLGEDPQATLKVASAVGRTFALDVLAPVHPELGDDERVGAALAVLERGDFVVAEQPTDAVFGFRHVITQEVAYGTIVGEVRARLHGRIGRLYEERAASDTDRLLDVLAHHFARSDDDDRRRRYVLKAAAVAARRNANRTAGEHYRNVLPLLDGAARIDAELGLGRALMLLGQLDEAEQTFTEAAGAANEQSDPVRHAHVTTAMGELARKRGHYDAAMAHFARARTALDQADDRAGVAEVLHLSATVAAQRGETALSREQFEASLALRRELDDPVGISRALNGLGIVAEYENDLPRATAHYAEALEILVELDNRWHIAALTNNTGYALLLQERFAEALPHFERAVALQREIGDPSMLANFLSNLGDAARELGDHPQARACYDEALVLARDLGERWLVCYLLEDVAVLAAHEGWSERALRLAAAGARLREEIGTPLPADSARLLDERLAPARTALGATAAARAHAYGVALSDSDAIDEALRNR